MEKALDVVEMGQSRPASGSDSDLDRDRDRALADSHMMGASVS
jgi:hypothetical protein